MKLLPIQTHKVPFLFGLVFFLLFVAEGLLHMSPHHGISVSSYKYKSSSEVEGAKEDDMDKQGMELYPTGSSLPDCSHACGPCTPCKRVTVSLKCSNSESCPIVYRCMCKGKYYHVPSN